MLCSTRLFFSTSIGLRIKSDTRKFTKMSCKLNQRLFRFSLTCEEFTSLLLGHPPVFTPSLLLLSQKKSIFLKMSCKLVTRIYILTLLCCVMTECFLTLDIATMVNVNQHLIQLLLKQNVQLIFFYSFFICFLKGWTNWSNI